MADETCHCTDSSASLYSTSSQGGTVGHPAIEEASRYLSAAYARAAAALEDGTPAEAGAAACEALTRVNHDARLWIELAEATSPAHADVPGVMPELSEFAAIEADLLRSAGLPRELAQDLADTTVLQLRAMTENPGPLQLEILRQHVQRTAGEVCQAAESLRAEAERLGATPKSKARRIATWLGRANSGVVQVARGFVCLGGLVVVVVDVAGVPHSGGASFHSVHAGAKMILG